MPASRSSTAEMHPAHKRCRALPTLPPQSAIKPGRLGGEAGVFPVLGACVAQRQDGGRRALLGAEGGSAGQTDSIPSIPTILLPRVSPGPCLPGRLGRGDAGSV